MIYFFTIFFTFYFLLLLLVLLGFIFIFTTTVTLSSYPRLVIFFLIYNFIFIFLFSFCTICLYISLLSCKNDPSCEKVFMQKCHRAKMYLLAKKFSCKSVSRAYLTRSRYFSFCKTITKIYKVNILI